MLFFKRYKIKRLKKKIRAMQGTRHNNPVDEEILIKERRLYRDLAKIYVRLIGHKKFPCADVLQEACYRAAAEIDDVEAKFWLANKLMEEARVRDGLEQEKIFSTRINARNMKQQYEEAHAWLEAAKPFNHIEAMRLCGLAHIHGWGVEPDKDKGFNMIMKSIDIEKSWDKVPEIFARIGLNKPEFFSALTSHRQQNNREA